MTSTKQANIEQPKPSYDIKPGQSIWYTEEFLTVGIYQVIVVEYNPQKRSPTDKVRRHDQVKVLANTKTPIYLTLYKPHWHVTREEAFVRIQQIIYQEQLKLLEAQCRAVHELFAA